MFKEKTTTLETLPNIITTQTPHKVYYKVMAGKKAVGVFLNYQDFQNILENLAELADAELTSSIKKTREEFAQGDGKVPTITISPKALKQGVVLIDLEEYQRLKKQSIPTYYLKGTEARQVDTLVKEGIKEYKAGKAKRISSLAELR